ncbi:MAG: hypothetical protein EOO04_33305 [Chitinophagaceae bacterium]|nr:MAG: hypothetical protein EOO04_33305 [Chitinophagaceae bacterium]
MKSPFTSIIIKLLVWINAAAAILLLISGYSYLLNPAGYWYISFTGLIFPVIAGANFIMMIVWIFIRKKFAIISFLALVACIPSITKVLALHPEKKFHSAKSTNAIRIVSWNVGLMNIMAKDTQTAIEKNLEILNALRTSDADVLCLQEFLTNREPDGHYNFLDSIRRTMLYPYYFFKIDVDEGFFVSGTVVLSRLPITDSLALDFPGPFHGSVVKTGIRFGKDTIDIITSRLQSLNFKRDEYAIFSNLKKARPDALKGSRTMLKKLRYAYGEREEQVKMITSLIEQSARPVIFTGDLNDVPASYAYHKIRGRMYDAWLKGGWGIGRTFRRISPTLRIDYIFSDRHLRPVQTKRLLTTGSDHYGLETDVETTNF